MATATVTVVVVVVVVEVVVVKMVEEVVVVAALAVAVVVVVAVVAAAAVVVPPHRRHPQHRPSQYAAWRRWAPAKRCCRRCGSASATRRLSTRWARWSRRVRAWVDD